MASMLLQAQSSGVGLFAGLAMVCAVIVALVLLAKLSAFVGDLLAGVRAWANLKRRERDAMPQGAFPVIPLAMEDDPGLYRVGGVLRETEQEVEWQIEAQTRANAVAKAELRGLVVTKVEKIAGPAAGREQVA
jgi:type II secretory pathway component PulF